MNMMKNNLGKLRFLALLIPMLVLVGCATDDDLFAEYNDKMCQVPIALASATAVAETSAGLPWYTSLYFEFDDSLLAPESTRRLLTNMETLKSDDSLSLVIRGFTDSLGDLEYNNALSQRRIDQVVDFYQQQGVSKQRIVLQKAMGESLHLLSNQTPVQREINRRVEMLLINQAGETVTLFYDKGAIPSDDVKHLKHYGQ